MRPTFPFRQGLPVFSLFQDVSGYLQLPPVETAVSPNVILQPEVIRCFSLFQQDLKAHRFS